MRGPGAGGSRVGVENSHAMVDRERAEGEFADCVERDIRGEITHVRSSGFGRSARNHPDVREYAGALYSDLVANYGLDYAVSAIVSFEQEEAPAAVACFCDSCRRAARGLGFDLATPPRALLDDPRSEPAADRMAGVPGPFDRRVLPGPAPEGPPRDRAGRRAALQPAHGRPRGEWGVRADRDAALPGFDPDAGVRRKAARATPRSVAGKRKVLAGAAPVARAGLPASPPRSASG